jgi:sodium transport system permease protein
MTRPTWIILRKELVDHLRDHRSLLSSLLFPLLGPLVMGVTFSMLASWHRTDKPLKLAVVRAEGAPSLMDFLQRAGAEVTAAPQDYEQQVRDGDLDVVLLVPADYGEQFRKASPATVQVLSDSSNQRARKTVDRARSLLHAYSGQVGALRLIARGVSPTLAQPVKLDELDVATKQQQAALLLNMIPVFLLMGAFIGGMHLAIDAMAGERERGSLEALLVNPVPASAVVLGKWLATVGAAVLAVLTMIAAFALTVRLVPLEELGMRAHFGPGEVLGILLVMGPLVLFTSAAQLLVATFASSFKEAQTYVSLVTFVPTLPGIFLTMSPLKPQAWMALVPSLGQQLLISDVMRGDPARPGWIWLAGLGALVSTAACLVATTRLLGREAIIYGR